MRPIRTIFLLMLGLNKFFVKRQQLDNAEIQLTRLKNEVASAKEFITNIEHGNLDADYLGSENDGSSDESLSTALVSMRDKLKVLNKKEEQRKWITEGLNKFMVMLRQQQSVEETAMATISEIVKYIGANQGGIYINNQEKETLELKAFYAYDRQKFLSQSFYYGEGLIGQVFLEKQTQLIKKVPDNYIRITSGLGDAPPNNIAIVPLKINDEVSGILEVASFTSLEEYHIEFLEKLGENIASSVATLKTTEQTQNLLKRSQEQAEELRTQEEEMQQNMEEMQTTQEELARKEAESKSVLNALNEAYYVAELDLEGSIFNANVLLKNLLMESQNLDTINGEDYLKLGESDIDGKELLEIVKQGASSSRTSSFKKSENKVWLSETYSPIYDAQNRVKKILVIASDITNEQIQREELKKKALEMNEVREKEKERADHSIRNQTKMMERYIEKAKAKETTLKTKIQQLESQLNNINQS